VGLFVMSTLYKGDPMPLTTEQLRSVMKFHLNNFNDEGVPIDDDTVLSDVVQPDDGFGAANSQAIFKAAIRWTLWNADHEDPTWPKAWPSETVRQLADDLLATTP
jgi:hypothetical protein